MFCFLPTILFAIQAIFLYFEGDLLDISDNSFLLIFKIISFNIFIILLVNSLKTTKIHTYKTNKLKKKLSNRKNSLIIFAFYIIFFLIQVLIRKSVPAFMNLELSYGMWAISPFSGFMTVLYLLILGERLASWIEIKSSEKNHINNLILFFMLLISLVMLRRDLLAFFIFGSIIKLYDLFLKTIKQLLQEFRIKKILLNQTKNIFIIFVIFILLFSGVGSLRRQGTGLQRAYWKIVPLYIATPLANSLAIINNHKSGEIFYADFFLGGSVSSVFLDIVGIENDSSMPKENFPLPQFNVTSSLGYFYQIFGEKLYILFIGFYSGLLTFIEINFKKSRPILFSLILIISTAAIFTHFWGTTTITAIFPLIYLIDKFRIRLL